jgi:hypothetical protein
MTMDAAGPGTTRLLAGNQTHNRGGATVSISALRRQSPRPGDLRGTATVSGARAARTGRRHARTGVRTHPGRGGLWVRRRPGRPDSRETGVDKGFTASLAWAHPPGGGGCYGGLMSCFRVTAALVALTLLSACSSSAVVAGNPAPAGGASSPANTSAGGGGSTDAGVPHAHVAAGGWVVQLNGTGPTGGTLSISPTVTAAVPAEVRASLAVLHAAVASDAGPPVQVGLSGGALPPGGATLARTLPAPLAPGLRATLASFDPAHQAWVPVATTLSADRRALSAHVSHFSIWDDISYGAGWLLDTRVPAPYCQGRVPA